MWVVFVNVDKVDLVVVVVCVIFNGWYNDEFEFFFVSEYGCVNFSV